MLFVAVGTFIKGFDELVEAADLAAGTLGIGGLAQIGHSSVVPRHLLHRRFMPPEEIGHAMRDALIILCHGGVGMLGEAMRAGRPIIAFPRRGPTTSEHPAGDQLPLLEKLVERYPIRLCRERRQLTGMIRQALEGPTVIRYALGTDVPGIIQDFLRSRAPLGPL